MLEGILNVFRALLAPVIAGVVAYIAYQQHKTNRDKLRFDLYDRRLKVFEGLMVLLWVIFRKGTCNDQERDQFQQATVEGSFLFDKDIANYLDTIQKKTLELGTIRAVLNLPGGEKRDQTVEKERQLFDWFTDQFEVSKEKFARYLSFRQSANLSERRTMNWKRGFSRLMLVLSFLPCLLWVIYMLARENIIPVVSLSDLLLLFAANFVVVWLIYGLLVFIVRGFCDANKRQKADQKQ
ncbi:hypothetical protein ES703_58282 [subsurface metagenome]